MVGVGEMEGEGDSFVEDVLSLEGDGEVRMGLIE